MQINDLNIAMNSIIKLIYSNGLIYRVIGLDNSKPSLECLNGENDYEEILYSDLAGIPLTNEWLNALGFEPCSNQYYQSLKVHDELFIIISGKGAVYFSTHGDHEWGLLEIMTAKHVHQVQNLYSAISGNNLPVALPSE